MCFIFRFLSLVWKLYSDNKRGRSAWIKKFAFRFVDKRFWISNSKWSNHGMIRGGNKRLERLCFNPEFILKRVRPKVNAWREVKRLEIVDRFSFHLHPPKSSQWTPNTSQVYFVQESFQPHWRKYENRLTTSSFVWIVSTVIRAIALPFWRDTSLVIASVLRRTAVKT